MRVLSILAIILVTMSCNSANRAEVQSKKVEKPKKTSIAEIEEGIRTYIAHTTEENDGYFPMPYEDDTMYLKLVRVHTEYLSNLGPERHFACVDLADERGDVYDVDFFLNGVPGNMSVTETTVHKENGKPFYSWKQNKKDKTWNRVPTKGADRTLLGVVEGRDEFDFTYSIKLPEIKKSAKIWIPISSSDNFQEIKILAITPEGGEMKTDPDFGNTYWYMELEPRDSHTDISITYHVERLEKGPYRDKTNPNAYLESSALLPVGGRFSEVLRPILADKRDESHLVQARAIYDFVIDTVRYRKAGEYGTGDANYACDSRSGNCTEFHSYFISLARTAGIPARFAIGAAIPSERNEGGVDGYHCWAEFYAEDKWWPVDISEANKYTALATYYFGHHPANRIEISKGRDIKLSPPSLAGNVPFFAYPVFELDGKSSLIKPVFTFTRKEKRVS